MSKRPTNALVITALLFIAAMRAKAEFAIHNIDSFPTFSSVNDITIFFSETSVPIKVLELKSHSTNNFILAAYPYAGVDTIDVFHFVKYGNSWKIKMVFFYLRPKYRRLTVAETETKILLFDSKDESKDELLSLTVDNTLNSPKR